MYSKIILLIIFLFCIYLPINSNRHIENDNVRIRVTQFNIGKLSMGKKNITQINVNNRKKNKQDFIELFKDLGSDIIGFNEFTFYFSQQTNGEENKKDKTKDAILKSYRYFESGEKNVWNCNCLVSRNYQLSNPRQIFYSKSKTKRYFLLSETTICGKKVVIISTHLEVPIDSESRDVQMRELIAATNKYEHVVICGDFNVRSTKEYDSFKNAGFTMANHGPFGDFVTFPLQNGGMVIDNILCKGFEVIGVRIDNTGLSDHFAFTCDLQMK